MEEDEARSPSPPWHYKWEPEGTESSKAGNSLVEEHARREVPSSFGLFGREIIGKSRTLRAVLEQVEVVAPTMRPFSSMAKRGRARNLSRERFTEFTFRAIRGHH
jgi:hypothetical protein